MKPQENGLNKMVEGKKHKFQGFSEASQRLPGGFQASQSFTQSMATAKEMAICNDIICTRA